MAQQKRTSKFKSSKYEAPKQRRITKQQIANATYKDVKLLEKFISDRGKIRSSLITGITKQEQANESNRQQYKAHTSNKSKPEANNNKPKQATTNNFKASTIANAINQQQ